MLSSYSNSSSSRHLSTLTLPLQARVPTHSQPRPSTADDYATDWWSDLTGGGGYYGSGGYDPSGAGGSRPAGVTRSDNEDDGRDDDDDE